MKVIFNRFIPFGRFAAINLCGIFFVKRGVAVGDSLLRHETIHTRQMMELLIVPFYLVYVIEWLVRIVAYRGDSTKAYYNISFEREAYAHDSDPSYLAHRPHYAQWRKKEAHSPST